MDPKDKLKQINRSLVITAIGFVIVLVTSLMAISAGAQEKKNPLPAISAADQVQLLKIVRDVQATRLQKTQLVQAYEAADKQEAGQQGELVKLIEKLKKDYKCEKCGMDLKEIRFTAPKSEKSKGEGEKTK